MAVEFPKTFNYARAGGRATAYYPARLDDTSDPSYYGYLSVEGYWIIMRQNESAGTIQYAVGGSNLETSWTGRADLSYQDINDLVT